MNFLQGSGSNEKCGGKNLEKWLNDNLYEVLSFPVPPYMVEYIGTIENDRDLDDYFRTLLDMKNSRHLSFVEEYKALRHASKAKPNDDNDSEGVKNKKKGGGGGKKSEGTITSENSENGDMDKGGTKSKKKNKYVNLYSEEGQKRNVIMLKGRHMCECQASKHKLVNNCLKCGRIVCTQEGSGPCLFCGTLVCSVEEQNILNSNSRESEKLYNNLMTSTKAADALNKAMAQRNKLLEFDRTTAQRSKVIDDESDYFNTNSTWLTKEERERLHKKEEEIQQKKHAPRSTRKFTFDFLEGKLLEEAVDTEIDEDFFREALDRMEETLAESHVHPDFPAIYHPLFVESKAKKNGLPKEDATPKTEKSFDYKVQDKELLIISDNGVCLSMHQPWASLLVSGIKRHEGRTWYTSHRGRLWIAAASKAPAPESIKDCEDFYRSILGDENLKFPTSYPTSCLLGCVSVVDCLPQEEYRTRYPNGESESPFVFVCEDAVELDIKFPISGSHKIYKLDGRIHQAARKALLRMAKNAKG